ncbi:extracellular solute-binding protein [Salinarimonas sp. NSM]|uniref:extracellular solute-binding protein n=1 Tax=Salinarimonas sp. NSM TaxID=3458003 RepID=UPI0040361774
MRNGVAGRGITRRGFFQGVAAVGGALALPGGALADFEAVSSVGQVDEDFVERHGMSLFGDLALPPDFTHFPYVNPEAPKGGVASTLVSTRVFNQGENTFDTFNIFVDRGIGAYGVESTFDSLMTGSGDEPTSVYGLLAETVSRSRDGLAFRFRLRPQARFHDGTPLTAQDVAFSITTLKEQGHNVLRLVLAEVESVEALEERLVEVRFAPGRSRNIPFTVAGLPVLPRAWFEGRDFQASTLEPILGSGPYRIGDFRQGSFVTIERVPDYWAADLPVNRGVNNFDRVTYRYYRDRDVAFQGFSAGEYTFRTEATSRIWANAYDFPAVREGRVIKEEVAHERPGGVQTLNFNLRRAKFADTRVREALMLAFDFESINRDIMYSSYERQDSYFKNSPSEAKGPPTPEELALLEPWRDSLPPEVFGEAVVPPMSDGSGRDREQLRRAGALLADAGCTRRGTELLLPTGEPFTIEFMVSTSAFEPHFQRYVSTLRLLGIAGSIVLPEAAQYQRRLLDFDFEAVISAFTGGLYPSESLLSLYGSQAADTPGSRNYAGIAHPAIDALIAIGARAQTREDASAAGRAIDRILRAGRYSMPMWYNSNDWVAYWDEFSRPERRPRYAQAGFGTWWYDPERAARANRRRG